MAAISGGNIDISKYVQQLAELKELVQKAKNGEEDLADVNQQLQQSFNSVSNQVRALKEVYASLNKEMDDFNEKQGIANSLKTLEAELESISKSLKNLREDVVSTSKRLDDLSAGGSSGKGDASGSWGDLESQLKEIGMTSQQLEANFLDVKKTIDSSKSSVTVYNNGLGETVKVYKKTTEEGEKYRVTLEKVNQLNQNTASQAKYIDTAAKALKRLGLEAQEVSNIVNAMNNKGASNWTVANKSIKANGDAVYELRNNLDKVVNVTQKNVNGTNQFSASLKNVTKNAKEATKEAGTWGYSWKRAWQSFLTYMSVTDIFFRVKNAIEDMVHEVEELDEALTELKKVTDFSADSLNKFIDEAYEAGKTVAKTGTEMIEAATQFAKAGYDEKEILKLGTVASMYTNIADETISAGEAAEFIIAQLKAFNLEASQAEHVIDAVNEVSNNFAVSSSDIANNLGKASAVMANAGNSMEQMIGIMTAGTEITRNASKVANGLKTITLRLQGMNDEGEKDLELQSQMESMFKKLGISVYDSNGELKNTYDILATLASVYQDLTAAEKAYVTETIAGKFQAQNAAAILNNWSTAVEATQTAMNSTGSAAKENAKVLESIKGHLQELASAWENLSREVISSNLIKNIVDLGTAILNIANSGFGRWIGQSALVEVSLVVLIASVSKVVKTFQNFKIAIDNWKKSGVSVNTVVQTMINKQKLLKLQTDINNIGTKSSTITLEEAKLAMQKYGIAIDTVKTKEQAQIAVNEALKASTLSLNLALGALSLAIGAAITIWQSHKQKAEQAAEASKQAAKEMADEAYNSYQESKKSLQEYEDKISSYKKTLEGAEKGSTAYKNAQDGLKKTQEELIASYPEWKDKIKATNEKLEEQLLLLKDINKEEAKRTEGNLRANKNEIEKRFKIQEGKGKWNGIDVRRYGIDLKDFDDNKIDKIVKKMREFEGVGNDIGKSYAFWGESIIDTYNAYEKLYNYIGEKGEEELGLTKEEVEALRDKISASKAAIEADYDYEEGIEGLKQYAEAFLGASDAYQEFINEIEARGKKGLLDSDFINGLLKGFPESDGNDSWDTQYEEISKWLKILGLDVDTLVEKYNVAGNKMRSFMGEIDKERLQAYRDEIKKLEEEHQNQTSSIFDVMDAYNEFYNELQNLSDVNEDSVSQLLDKYPVLKKALADNGNTIQDVINDMKDYSDEAANFYDVNEAMDYSDATVDSLDKIKEKYKDVIGVMDEYGYTIEDIENYESSALPIFDEINNRLNINIDTVKVLRTEFATLKEDIDSLSGSYSTLTGAVDEYNQNGYLTIDTLMNLLSLEDGWINALNIENGQMSINEQGIQQMVNDRLDEADALAIQTAYSQLQKIAEEGEAGAVEYLKGKYGKLKTALDNAALSYDAVAEAAARYKKVENISDTEIAAIDDIMDSLDKRLELTKKYRQSSSQNFRNSMGASSRSSSSGSRSSSATTEKEWWEKEYDALKAQFDYSEITIEQYIGGLENLLGRLDKGSEAWRKINKELQKQKFDKIKDDYDAGRISLNQYIISLQNLQKAYAAGTAEWNKLAKAIKKAKIDKLKEQEDSLNSALSAVNNTLEKQKDAYKEAKEAAEEKYDKEIEGLKKTQDALEKQTNEYEQAKKAVDDFLSEQLEAINNQKTAVEDYYDNVVSSLERMNEEQEEAVKLAEAYEALMNAMTQKTKKVWKEGLGWVWTSDQKAIEDAKKNYDDLVKNAATKDIEKQKEKTVKSLDEQIEALQKYIDSWDKVFDKFEDETNKSLADKLLGENWAERMSQLDPQIVEDFSNAYYDLQVNIKETEDEIERLNELKDQQNEYWESLIKDLETYQDKWKDVKDSYGETQDAIAAAQLMGANWEEQILNKRLDVLENFKNKYNRILSELDKMDAMSENSAVNYNPYTLPGFSGGGEVDFTGLAMLHGSPSKPEYVLNNDQMKNLLSSLVKPRFSSNLSGGEKNKIYNYNFGNIELPNVNNAQQFINELKSLVNVSRNL